MRVFLCCLQSQVHTSPRSGSFWRTNFKSSLERMGHDVLEPRGIDLVQPLLDRSSPKRSSGRRAADSAALLEQVRVLHAQRGIDLFLSYFWAVHIEPATLRDIERLGIATVNFFCDNLREFHEVAEIVGAVSLNWVPERDACEVYRKRNAPYLHLPLASDPEVYHPIVADHERDAAVFVGSPDYLRAELLAEALAAGVPLEVYGDAWLPPEPSAPPSARPRALGSSFRQHRDRLRWYGLCAELRHFATRARGQRDMATLLPRARPGVPHAELLRLFASSAVVLGVNRCPHPAYSRSRPLVYSRLRDMEAPMAGACYLTEDCSDLRDLFQIGEEILVFRDAAELVEQSTRLRRDAGLRARLRAAGRRASLARHTWEHRFERLFRTLGLHH